MNIGDQERLLRVTIDSNNDKKDEIIREIRMFQVKKIDELFARLNLNSVNKLRHKKRGPVGPLLQSNRFRRLVSDCCVSFCASAIRI